MEPVARQIAAKVAPGTAMARAAMPASGCRQTNCTMLAIAIPHPAAHAEPSARDMHKDDLDRIAHQPFGGREKQTPDASAERQQ